LIEEAVEQAGRRPALVLSPLAFNELTGRCIACPITRRDRNWSFHVAIPDNDEISGVVQSDQLRSASWEQRGSRFICRAPATVLDEVRARIKPLLLL
jgi:mRNA interferase MazF